MIAGKVVNVPRIKALDGSLMKRFVMSPDGKYIAFFGKFGSIHLVTTQSKEWIGSMQMNGDVKALAFNDDGTQMFSHGVGEEVYVWDVRQRLCCHRFIDDGCGTCGTTLALSPGGQYLATGSKTGYVNIYDTASCLQSRQPKPLKAFKNLTTCCTETKFNATAEILAIASRHELQAVKLVHVPSLSVFHNFPTKADKIGIPTCLDFSVHSGYFAVGNEGGCALQYRLPHYRNY
jgi:U3 small nucleolar RNA-associated protein 18